MASSDGPHGTHAAMTMKTRLCRHYEQNGHCSHGSRCTYAHGPAELRGKLHPRVTSDNGSEHHNARDLTKTRLCSFHDTPGGCLQGLQCSFAHGEADLVPPPPSAPRPSVGLRGVETFTNVRFVRGDGAATGPPARCRFEATAGGCRIASCPYRHDRSRPPAAPPTPLPLPLAWPPVAARGRRPDAESGDAESGDAARIERDVWAAATAALVAEAEANSVSVTSRAETAEAAAADEGARRLVAESALASEAAAGARLRGLGVRGLPAQELRSLITSLEASLAAARAALAESEAASARLCVLCAERPRDRLLSACRHVIACGPCAARLTACPACRSPIAEPPLEIFFS